jgi:hypothetical protein
VPRRTIKGEGKKVPLNMRTTAELRATIEARAGRSGRSMVQEVEYLVQYALWHEREGIEILARQRRDEGIERRLCEIRDELTSLATIIAGPVGVPFNSTPEQRALLLHMVRRTPNGKAND